MLQVSYKHSVRIKFVSTSCFTAIQVETISITNFSWKMTPQIILTQLTLLIHLTSKISPSSAHPINEHDKENNKTIHHFRSMIKPKIYPSNSHVHNFIRDDQYILQWLRRNDFNVERAYCHLMEHLAWRTTEKIDGIHLEDWDYYQSEYPQFTDTADKTGRPVAEVWLSEWNIRKAVMSGQSQRLSRWMIYLLEMTQRRLFEIRRGKGNVSSAVEIIDLDGFNTWQHGCLNCIPIYMNLGRFCENQYPAIWESIYMLNVGSTFRSFLSILGTHFNYGQKTLIKSYSGRKEWMPVMDREIGRDQRSVRFGGHMDRNSS